ncbi:MAG: hypothetical protein ACI8XM_000081 [Haloarculaceae archaeon]|jgi:hypothetical protein
MPSEMHSEKRMRSSNPTGTIPETAKGVLTVLEASLCTEPFEHETALDVLTAEEYPPAVDDGTAEMVQQFSDFEYEAYLETLEQNGYLYTVDDKLRITP